jgi:hypothetical protein
MALLAADSSPTSFLRFGHAPLSHQHRVWSANSGDLFPLVANDRCDTQLEIFGALDCSLQRFPWVKRRIAHGRAQCCKPT